MENTQVKLSPDFVSSMVNVVVSVLESLTTLVKNEHKEIKKEHKKMIACLQHQENPEGIYNCIKKTQDSIRTKIVLYTSKTAVAKPKSRLVEIYKFKIDILEKYDARLTKQLIEIKTKLNSLPYNEKIATVPHSMENYETYKEAQADEIFKSLQEGFHKEMAEAPDKKYTHNDIYLRAIRESDKVQNDNGLYRERIINLRQEIDHLLRTTKNTYSSAFEHFTKEYRIEEKKAILEKIANIEAHLKYCKFLKEQEKRFSTERDTSKQELTEEIENITLSDLFKDPNEYKKIMKQFVEKGYCEPSTYTWIDREGTSKGFLMGILKNLKAKKYYKPKIKFNATVCMAVAQNTFGITVSRSTYNNCKKIHRKFFDFIPASQS